MESLSHEATEHQKLLAEWCPPRGHTHADKLPESNVLRHMPYWDGPGGRNLSIIDGLEWVLTHLYHCNKELPCKENQDCIELIETAIIYQKHRRNRRVAQGVLGTNKPHVS